MHAYLIGQQIASSHDKWIILEYNMPDQRTWKCLYILNRNFFASYHYVVLFIYGFFKARHDFDKYFVSNV